MQTPKISKGTLIRTIVLFIALINGALAMFGKQLLPVGEIEVGAAVDAVYAAISAVTLFIAAIAGWWKNNNITKRARIEKAQIKRNNQKF